MFKLFQRSVFVPGTHEITRDLFDFFGLKGFSNKQHILFDFIGDELQINVRIGRHYDNVNVLIQRTQPLGGFQAIQTRRHSHIDKRQFDGISDR